MRVLVCRTDLHATLLYQLQLTQNHPNNRDTLIYSKFMITYLLIHRPTTLVVYSSECKKDFYSVYAHICDDDNYRKVVSDEEDELPILDML
jgi:hypothetical protein